MLWIAGKLSVGDTLYYETIVTISSSLFGVLLLHQNRVIPSFQKQIDAYLPAAQAVNRELWNAIRQTGMIEYDLRVPAVP
jgi:hypothetical protein